MQNCLQTLTRQKKLAGKTKTMRSYKIAWLPQSVTRQQELMADKPNKMRWQD
jgi:hypothetical protein